MIVGSHKRMIVYKKTGFKCSVCGSTDNLMCACFIPEWTRVIRTDIENLIPLCEECNTKRGQSFLEIGQLRYLPDLYIDQLMMYYTSIKKYLYYYVRLYAKSRTNVDVNTTLVIMQSYDSYIQDNAIDWEAID